MPVSASLKFYSEVITQTEGSVSVAATSSADVYIQPPAGETWWVFIDVKFGQPSNYVQYNDYDGATARLHSEFVNYQEYYTRMLGSESKILTNSLYGDIHAYNSQSSAVTLYYGYSGFKLGTKKWSPIRTADPKPYIIKPSKYNIPSELSSLSKYIEDRYLFNENTYAFEYTQVLVLEKNTVLATDPTTGFPVERLDIHIKTKDLLKPFIIGTLKYTTFLDYIKAKPVETGFKKYLDKWKAEGITV